MKTTYGLQLVYWFLIVGFCSGCATNEQDLIDLVGQEGDPRFNLSFDNSQGADLDLYVKTPNDVMMYFANTKYEGGRVDVDCLCGDCPDGPNENIYWEAGTAQTGKYEYWVEYYDSCSADNPPVEFTLRVTQNGKLLALHNGTLTKGMSNKFVHIQ